MQLAEGEGGGPGFRSVPDTETVLPSVEAKAALFFLLLLHRAVTVLNWLSWQLAHRCLCTFVSRSRGVVLFPGKLLGCEDEATKAEFHS